MPKKVFLTFSTSDWVGTRTRLYFRALECGWFDEVVTMDETVVPDEYKNRLNEPFHGYYFWKPIAVYKQLEKLNDGDILVFVDSGSDINLSGYKFFEEKISLLETYGVVVYGYTFLRQFCNPEILFDFGITIDDAQKIPAVQSNQIYIRRNADTLRAMREWMDYMVQNPQKIIMDFKSGGDIDGFVQNRPDQAVLAGVLFKHNKLGKILEPNYDYMVNCRNLSGMALRASECDIIPTRKKFDYKPYVMFVIGSNLPFFEKSYDEYTHFINVGNKELHRCTDSTGDNIHRYSGAAEQTGIYWIWKNVDLSHVKYIGVSTHRKPFLATNGEIYGFLEGGASVVANRYFQDRKKSHLTAFDEAVFDDIVCIFKKHHPEYVEDFVKHESCGTLFPSSSFVMRVEDFYKMCEFVFPVVMEVAEKYDGFIGNDRVNRFPHAVPAGCFGEDFISFYIMKFLGSKISYVPFIIYPKDIELFRAETQPCGMIFGTNGNRFYPHGFHPRTPAMIQTDKQYLPGGFYPDYSGGFTPPNIIQTKSYEFSFGGGKK